MLFDLKQKMHLIIMDANICTVCRKIITKYDACNAKIWESMAHNFQQMRVVPKITQVLELVGDEVKEGLRMPRLRLYE